MKKYIILFILGCMLFADDKDPFEFSAPKDWRPERIAFPLSFAPEIKYDGFEELRFAPGMFSPEKDDYFCYVFFLWIEEKVSLDQKKIHEILLAYYKGLCKAVAEKRKLELNLDDIKVSVEKTKEKESKKVKYLAVVDWYDPFVTGKKLSLHMDIELFHSEDNSKSILFACVSPHKPTSENKTWATMYSIRNSFKLKSPNKKQSKDKN
ncbi:hypothetical protein [Candidatus Uabimicrobium amorphum]|uniref:Uncharacterized protein n=1 Tax=Uabimicrobium amorphum TaxID=2596890 RepID=A0A5S9F421_UABAM|nr:hypothetical protein [Candidatus Uabimicrobium amorphum]BBM85296.1 hypothetical protein UABAM_03660 [Candidatus Uabimicrobium amorphum]